MKFWIGVLALLLWVNTAQAVLIVENRVNETSTTTGTGSLTLAGATTNHVTFNAAIGVGNTTYCGIVHRTVAEWEFGICTLSGSTTLARTTVYSTWNGTTLCLTACSAISLSAGTKDVFVGFPAEAIPVFGVNAQTGTTYTVLETDRGKLVTHTNASAIAVTLPQATVNFAAGWFYDVQNRGAGTVTITPTTSTIDGAATLALTTGTGVRIVSDGANYFTQRGGGGTTAYAGSSCSAGQAPNTISAAGAFGGCLTVGGPTYVRITGDVTMPSASATYSDVTGLTFTPAANKDYWIEYTVTWTSDTDTNGADFSVNGPASPTSVNCSINSGGPAPQTANLVGSAYDTNSNKGINAASSTGTNQATITCLLRNGSTSSAFVLRERLEAGTAAVHKIKAGSAMRYTLLN